MNHRMIFLTFLLSFTLLSFGSCQQTKKGSTQPSIIETQPTQAEEGEKRTTEETKVEITAVKPADLVVSSETRKQSTLYIVGIQEQVEYDNYKALEKAVEALWTNAYNDDFSTKLTNILDANQVYVSYSNYDRPKGTMTITLGYKVKDSSNIPAGLIEVKIPSNDYLVYPLSGDKSDFQGEGWEQLGELMMYRKAGSVDFEVYALDSNYEVEEAELWVATK